MIMKNIIENECVDVDIIMWDLVVGAIIDNQISLRISILVFIRRINEDINFNKLRNREIIM